MASDMFEHQDLLANLNKASTLSDKLDFIHDILKTRFDFIDRVAIAIYDDKTDLLKTFIHSSDIGQPLHHYHAKLAESPSLKEMLTIGKPRVINDLDIFNQGQHEHTQRIAASGYHASYTLPMYMDGNFIGFIFYNSRQTHVFDHEVLHYLDLFGHMVSLLIAQELTAVNTLFSTLQAARHISNFRDQETGSHLERMSHYSLLIANHVAKKFQLSDEYIEHIFLFSPMHDIGKIGIPDAILKKPDKLTEDEFTIMKEHATKGREIIDIIMKDAHLDAFPHIQILRNITEFHHESFNGAGYPQGLHDTEIPIEARIIAVADVFDALTSARPYKERWSNEDAFNMLRKLSGFKLDPDCVDAMLNNLPAIEEIQASFSEAPYGYA